jgi:hypothetical protein
MSLEDLTIPFPLLSSSHRLETDGRALVRLLVMWAEAELELVL